MGDVATMERFAPPTCEWVCFTKKKRAPAATWFCGSCHAFSKTRDCLFAHLKDQANAG